MRRRRTEVLVALACTVLLAFGGFTLLIGPTRDLEVFLILSIFRGAGDRASVVGDRVLQLLPPEQNAFRAELTPYCSALIPMLALACIALFVLHGNWPRRVGAAAVAMAFVLLANVARISGSLALGYEFGDAALVLFHDWVGTFFALVYTLAGFFLMLYLILPSATAAMPRAARVSDVL